MANTATKFGTVAIGAAIIGALITNAVKDSVITRGNVILDTTTNTTPSIQIGNANGTIQSALTFKANGDINTGSGDIIADTYRNPEFCGGFTGSLLCQRLIKLTYSGGLAKYTAGSFTCPTQSCSLLQAKVFSKSGADQIYVGWTNSPGTASGAQVMNYKILANGQQMTASGAALGLVPVNATLKAVWAHPHAVVNDIAYLFVQYIKYAAP